MTPFRESFVFLALALLLLTSCNATDEVPGRGSAAEVFHRFETTLSKIEDLSMRHSLLAISDDKEVKASWSGRFEAIREPFQMSLTAIGEFGGENMEVGVSVFGDRLSTTGGPRPVRQQVHYAPKRWSHIFARLGLATDLWRTARGAPPFLVTAEEVDDIEVSDLRFDGTDFVNGELARILAYHLRFRDALEGEVRIWFSEETGHPIKRHMDVESSGERLDITETYSDIEMRG